ncbi:helix-turn-helix transcriptional regulator [Actinoplanes sp. NPDC051861]|uniref:helix-turn-helix transcriptional regulator n=1 Tax=Actinoplanes sp. NPDC051861 TaxID=3155170 RepID=UPI0034260074
MQREQLADFLRRRREAIHPAEVGIAVGTRRRTAGLRREEVAMLAGMSVDYVVRLEQGRSSQPSAQLLGALARALRLTDDERTHLFYLAGHLPPPADGVASLARSGLVRMLYLLSEHAAAMVLSDLGEILAQNRTSALLTGGLRDYTDDRRYMIYRWFTDPAARAIHPVAEQERHARHMVADLRATAGRRAGDPIVTGLVERLEAASEDFRRLWAEHEVAVRRDDQKTLVHPQVGPLLMDCETLVTPDQGQMLLVLTPADVESRDRLELLRVVGTEEFPADSITGGGHHRDFERPARDGGPAGRGPDRR